nr:MAG TPA: hypothetical protein [Caudoviricetes sp.]
MEQRIIVKDKRTREKPHMETELIKIIYQVMNSVLMQGFSVL